METIILPHDNDLESIVLGTIISNKNGYNEVREILTDDCFYNSFHKEIFKLFKELELSGNGVDIILLSSEYHKRNNKIIVSELMDLSELSEYVRVYAHACRLLDLQMRRSLIMLGYTIQQKAQQGCEDIADIISLANESVSGLYRSSENTVFTIQDAIKGVYDIINKNSSNENRITGSPTGFETFDIKSGGLQGSDLVIIAAETSQGKTSFALSIANNVTQYGDKIAIYSLEMKKEQLAARLMSMNSNIPANNLLYSRLDQYQFEKLDKSISSIYNSAIYFDDRSTSNIDVIINSIRSMVLKYGIKGTIIDYLQILNVNMKDANEERQMGTVARRLKNLAKELDIWIIALSQLNRDHTNPVPNLNRLRSSGQIAEAADIVMFVYRPEVYGKAFPEPFQDKETAGYALIDVAKGRNIGLMKMLCRFDKEITHFEYVRKDEVPIGISSKSEPAPF